MDPFDERIMSVLKDGRPRNFHQLLGEVDFSHNTLRTHLNALVEKGLIVREKMSVKGRGRPRFMYSMPRGALHLASSIPTDSVEVVSMTFKELKRLCRFQRGGRCRKIKNPCEAQNCPQIHKTE